MVGMAEVSSVEITMPIGRHFKGEQLGMFHFGGSTHCLVFGPRVRLHLNFPDNLPGPDNAIEVQWLIKSALAVASKAI